MEISEVILSQALEASNSSSIHEELSAILKKLETQTFQNMLKVEKSKKVSSLHDKILTLINKNVYFNISVESIAQIIATAKQYLQKGIANADLRSIFVFLSVNCYLQIDIKTLLSNAELEESQTNTISEEILKLLKKINLTAQLLPNAPYHEKEMMREFTEGFANNDLTKTYRMIEGIERGGQGFHFNFLVENLLSFLFNANFKGFTASLSSLKNPTEFVFYLQSFKTEELLKIANEPLLKNKWLNFEIIRQIIEKEKKEGFDDLEVEGIKKSLGRIQKGDFSFLKQTVIYFHTSCLFNASSAEILFSLSNSEIEEVIFECFPINKYHNDLQARDAFKAHCVKIASTEEGEFLLTLTFKKWKQYFENILETEDFYQNELLLTDFANFVIHYHCHFTDDKSLISIMKNLIEKIKFIDSEWATSSFQLITKFHLYHSELFLLSHVYRDKCLKDSILLESYRELITNPIQCLRYITDETENNLKQALLYIDWIHESNLQINTP
jgi:hypothetical protein